MNKKERREIQNDLHRRLGNIGNIKRERNTGVLKERDIKIDERETERERNTNQEVKKEDNEENRNRKRER